MAADVNTSPLLWSIEQDVWLERGQWAIRITLPNLCVCVCARTQGKIFGAPKTKEDTDCGANTEQGQQCDIMEADENICPVTICGSNLKG